MSTVDDLLARRARHVPGAMSLHYDRPLHIVRGEGTYLFDANGTRYLDCINNVAHVGHANPHVAEAVSRQMRVLDTNARFLYPELFDYLERLTALLPEPLHMCFLVNSGSEANELALRLARTHTRRRGVVTLDGAYHGNTGGLIDISPYKFDGPGGEGRPPHVQVATTPDPYDGRFRGPDAGARYADDVAAAFERAQADGIPAGTFIAEALLGCAGQVDPPSGYLAAAYAAAHAAGAVCIADEVQIGFGRMGDTFWGFLPPEVLHSQARSDTSRGPQNHHRSGVVPDIVTMGKPIGNGHPLGAVVTTAEIAESFTTGMEYFNTFGGNPVSCVAGSAVLDVIEQDGLQDRARVVGDHLDRGFRELAQRHAVIGDSRGRGLFRGIALVRDRGTHDPATDLARTLVRRLREEQQILLSVEGPGDNVVKFKPPMTFSVQDADRVLDAVDSILTSEGA